MLFDYVYHRKKLIGKKRKHSFSKYHRFWTVLCKLFTRICLDCIEKNIEFPSHPKQEKNTNKDDDDDDEKELLNKYTYIGDLRLCV